MEERETFGVLYLGLAFFLSENERTVKQLNGADSDKKARPTHKSTPEPEIAHIM